MRDWIFNCCHSNFVWMTFANFGNIKINVYENMSVRLFESHLLIDVWSTSPLVNIFATRFVWKTCDKEVRKAGMHSVHKILKNWSRKRRERQTSVPHTLGWRSIAGFDHVKLLPSLEWRSNAGISEAKGASAMKNCRSHRGNTKNEQYRIWWILFCAKMENFNISNNNAI